MSSTAPNKTTDWTEIRKQFLPDDAESLLPKDWKLPILPQAVTNFLNHANQPNYDMRVLSRIVEQDGNLTCELLKHVNSSAFGLRHRISSVRKALVALGVRRAKMVLLTSAVHSTVKKFNSKLFDLHQFWTESLERSRFAREVARALRVDPELSSTGAMLQDFLIPVLGHAFLQEYVAYWNQDRDPTCDLHKYELAQFGVQHAQVGAICLMKWNVPDDLICAVLCHHMSYEDLEKYDLIGTHVHAVAASSLIPTEIKQHRSLAVRLSLWSQQEEGFDLYQVAERVDREYEREESDDNRESLAQRIEDCLLSHLSADMLQDSLVDRQCGNFILEQCVGTGASGSVFRARHRMMNRPAAVKVLTSAELTPGEIERFEREVQMTSQLQHPHIISIYDFGRTTDGLFYYAMEFIEGISLKQLVEQYGAQPEGRVVHILTQVCQAMQHAHESGLVHRDIKPENVAISQRKPMGDHATVLDFGLVIEESNGEDSESGIAGTPLYLAPEMIDSPGKSNASADLYAIGAVGYYMLTGKPLYTGNNAVDICLKQLTEIPPAPSTRLGHPIAEDLERIIMQCLDKSPQNRPQTAEELEQQLRACSVASSWSSEDARLWWCNQNTCEIQSVCQESPQEAEQTLIGEIDVCDPEVLKQFFG